LEKAHFVNCRQHWIAAAGEQTNRPYVCITKEADCPLCAIGDTATAMYAFNVLWLSSGEFPVVKVLKVGTKAYQNLKDVATPRNASKPVIDKDYFAVQRTGPKGQQQTGFRPVKERDLKDDWAAEFEAFNLDDLPDIIEEAKGDLYDPSIIQRSSKQKLEDLAKYASDE
jgi:hypothetical protein